MDKKQKIIFSILFVFLLFFQVLPVIRNGLNYSYGIGFWGSNGHDAVWHLSLINHINNPFDIDMPIFSGEKLQNYHPFFNILIAFLSKITHIPSSVWLFQLAPLIISGLTLYFSYLIGKKITNKFSGGIYLMFFSALANSFGWLITLIRDKTIAGESMFWSMQSASNQLNPPYALSILFLSVLIYLIFCKKTIKIKHYILILILLIFIPITKAYGGVVAYIIFGLFSLFTLFKKNYKPAIVLLISLPLSYLIFSLYNSQSGQLFIFKPLWFTNSLIESPDRLYIPFLANMRYTLELSEKFSPRLIALHITSIILFYVGNFSWRLIGVFSIKKYKNPTISILLITTIISATIPLLFIQTGTSWNTIQFLYYSLFLSNILLVYTLVKIKQNYLGKFLIFIIISTTLISNFETLHRFLSNPAHTSISQEEQNALKFLSTQPKGIVLTYPYNKYQKQNITTSPIPIYAYETTSYVSAFSKQIVYFEDEMNLEITGYDWKSRRHSSEEFFSTTDKHLARGFLLNNEIDYIYLTSNSKFQTSLDDLEVDKIFDNSQTQIYKIRK